MVRKVPWASSQRPVNRPLLANCHDGQAHGSGRYPTRQTAESAATVAGWGAGEVIPPRQRRGPQQ